MMKPYFSVFWRKKEISRGIDSIWLFSVGFFFIFKFFKGREEAAFLPFLYELLADIFQIILFFSRLFNLHFESFLSARSGLLSSSCCISVSYPSLLSATCCPSWWALSWQPFSTLQFNLGFFQTGFECVHSFSQLFVLSLGLGVLPPLFSASSSRGLWNGPWAIRKAAASFTSFLHDNLQNGHGSLFGDSVLWQRRLDTGRSGPSPHTVEPHTVHGRPEELFLPLRNKRVQVTEGVSHQPFIWFFGSVPLSWGLVLPVILIPGIHISSNLHHVFYVYLPFGKIAQKVMNKLVWNL